MTRERRFRGTLLGRPRERIAVFCVAHGVHRARFPDMVRMSRQPGKGGVGPDPAKVAFFPDLCNDFGPGRETF